MGQYNPHRPSILGQEWAPMKELPYLLDTETERGVTFVLDTTSTIVSGAVYLDDVPPNFSNKGVVMSVYRTGTEHLTGPIQRVVVPPISGIARLTDTGSDLEFDPNNITFAEVLANPNDGAYAIATDDAEIYVFFDTSSVSSLLSGKRILEVNILYAMDGTQDGVPGPVPDIPISHFISAFRGNPDTGISTILGQGSPIIAQSVTTIPEIQRVRLGNTNVFGIRGSCLDGAQGPVSFFWPTRQGDLANWDTGVAIASRMAFQFFQTDGCSGCTSINLPRNRYSYCAMEILYCEETRLLYGGRGRYACGPQLLQAGQNKIMLRAPDTFAAGATLTPGEYTVTVTMADMGDYLNGIGGNYSATALLQKYELPSHKGIVIDTRARVGGTFSRETSNLLPRVTLHTSGGVVTGVHTYDQLADAPVYDGFDVAPDVVSKSGGVAVPYPQVRFYARRVGDTNVPLTLQQQSDPTNKVSISADDFDALPEIVDGWREVTLRFPDSDIPTYSSAGSITWEFIADGLHYGSHWEILTPYGPSASSGVFDTSTATYGGNTAWAQVGPSSLDFDADTTLIFSQDPPPVSGFAVEVAEQSLEPIGSECAVEPRCVPTGLYFNHLTWDARDVVDTFEDRTESNEWGDAESGQPWTHLGGSADDYFVVTGTGNMNVDTVGTLYMSLVDAQAYNVEVRGRVKIPVVPSGAGITIRLPARYEDSSNWYESQLSIGTSGSVILTIAKRVAGTLTTIAPLTTLDGIHVAGDIWNVAFRCQADELLAKAWKNETPEPLAWQVVAVALPGDSLTGTTVGAVIRAETGFSGGTFVASWYEFSATDLDITGFELQRRDAVDDEWHAIMLSTGTAVSEFNDYEARVGVESEYRIRTVNALSFYGNWSTSLFSTVTSPGVTGLTDDGNSVLIFTTNEVQDGASNLAYVMTWDSNVSEDFSFPEAGTVQLRDLYRRDFPVAFHPLERGGERFSRDIIVQNAAVPTGRMRDGFRSLRDLAWEEVSYVAVRNELGDVWLTAVIVPSGKILRNRRLYIARIDVAEVTDTPSIVDPGV